MGNPLFSALFGGNSLQNGSCGVIIPNELKSVFNAYKTAQNPQQFLSQIAQSNPRMAEALKMCNGKNPEQLFYAMCQQRGVDPNTILNQLR